MGRSARDRNENRGKHGDLRTIKGIDNIDGPNGRSSVIWWALHSNPTTSVLPDGSEGIFNSFQRLHVALCVCVCVVCDVQVSWAMDIC